MAWEFVGVKMPLALRTQLEQMAQADQQTLSAWVRERIAREAQQRLSDAKEYSGEAA